MLKSGYTALQYQGNETVRVEGITSLTISNHGNSDLYVIIDNVRRKVPALNPLIGIPMGSFNMPGDGTVCNLEIKLEFDGGQGDAIVDYRKLTPQTC
jgi:hypothetical protein